MDQTQILTSYLSFVKINNKFSQVYENRWMCPTFFHDFEACIACSIPKIPTTPLIGLLLFRKNKIKRWSLADFVNVTEAKYTKQGKN